MVSERPTLQVSAEDTFEHDVLLHDTEDTIRRLADKIWAAAAQGTERIGRTVVLKLKTSRLPHPHPQPHAGAATGIARGIRSRWPCALLDRVDLPSRTRYRLVGIGLGNFRHADELPPQPELFDAG